MAQLAYLSSSTAVRALIVLLVSQLSWVNLTYSGLGRTMSNGMKSVPTPMFPSGCEGRETP